MRVHTAFPPVFKTQSVGVSGAGDGYIQAALTSTTWYTVLDTTRNVRVIAILFHQATANEDIEVRITDSAGIETLLQTAVAGQLYMIKTSHGLGTTRYIVTATDYTGYKPFLFDEDSIKVEIRKTSAAGANNTTCKVLHQQHV